MASKIKTNEEEPQEDSAQGFAAQSQDMKEWCEATSYTRYSKDFMAKTKGEDDDN